MNLSSRCPKWQCDPQPMWRHAITLLLVFGLTNGLIADQRRLFLAPETVRPQFDVPVIPPENGLSGTRKPQPISTGWMIENEYIGRLTGRHDRPFPGLPRFPRDVFVADNKNKIVLPNGEELWIDQIEMIYRTGPDDTDISFGIFDGAMLEPAIDSSKNPEDKVYGPTLKLKFAGPANLVMNDTMAQFANGVPFVQNGTGQGFWDAKTKLGFQAPLYSMPFIVTSEFQYGPAKRFAISLEVNAVYRNDDFEVRVIASTYFPPGAEPGPIELGERGKELQLRDLTYQPEKHNDGRTICCLEFVPLNRMPRGFKREGGGLTWFGRHDDGVEFLQIENTDGGPPKKLEFTYRDRALAIFRIPKIPGVPEENENLANVFDLKVPYVKFEDATDHFWFIANHSGLKFSALYERYPYPEVSYPISYSNVTLMDMIEDWRMRYGVHEFILDEDKGLVEITDPK